MQEAVAEDVHVDLTDIYKLLEKQNDKQSEIEIHLPEHKRCAAHGLNLVNKKIDAHWLALEYS